MSRPVSEQMAPLAAQAERRPRRRRRRVVAAACVVLILVAGAIAVDVANPLGVTGLIGVPSLTGIRNPFGGGGSGKSGTPDNPYPTSLANVIQRELTSQVNVNGTLGYAGSYNVVNQASGTFTDLPSVGQVVSQGQSLYSVDGSPVVLLCGSTPAYRALSQGMTGADVQQLNADLVALGYATSTQIDPASDKFTWWTKVALEKLQAHLGVTASGTLALGQAVFLPGAVRVTEVAAKLGAAAQPGPVLTATSTTRKVSIALDAAQQSAVKVGDAVTITLPNRKTTPGVVSSVGSVATKPSAGNATIDVAVTPTDPGVTGTLDQAPVQVSISTASVKNALAVPVNALLARSDGSYAVEVVDARGVHRLVPVSLGLFDDAEGLVQVSGTQLRAGQSVVVPAV